MGNKYTKFLIIAITLLTSCKKEPDVLVDYSSEDFKSLWNTTEDYYPFFRFKNLDWDSIYNVYQHQFINLSEEDKILLLGQLLNELKDGHANLFDERGAPLSYYTPRRSIKDAHAFSHLVVRNYFTSELKVLGEIFRYEILPDNLGYVYISSFPQNEITYKLFDQVLEYVKDTKGLIIDIRHNGGGSTNASEYFISRLISKELEGVLWSNRGGGYRPIIYYYPKGDFQYTKKTVLLINGKSFSTSEAMANLCKKIDHITLIGDTTGGGGGIPDEIFVLPSKLKFRVPTRYELRYDGEQIEWNGIPPDILIPQTKENIDNNRDLQLEKSIDYLN